MSSETEPTIDPRYEQGRHGRGLDYARAVHDGQLEARLDQHEKRLDKINGSMDRLAVEMASLGGGVQRLGDQAIAAVATAAAAAAALKEADQARAAALVSTASALRGADADRRVEVTEVQTRKRAEEEQRWAPKVRLAAILAGCGAFIGSLATVYLAAKP